MIMVRGLLRGIAGGAVVGVAFSVLALIIGGRSGGTIVDVLWFVAGFGVLGLGFGAVCGLAASLVVMALSTVAPNWVLRTVSGVVAAVVFKLAMMALVGQINWQAPSALDLCAFVAGVILCPGDVGARRASYAGSTPG